ncbi:MAG: DUF5691 domain-containing protein [Pirellulales bacterium]|nr:DUF5691 domain-containing protein [Pirellulales bacterium]
MHRQAMDELLHAAMLGTSRVEARLPQPSDELALWAEEAAAGSPQRRLLLEAGARCAYGMAGYAPEPAVPPAAPAPSETLAACPHHLVELFESLLASDVPQEVLIEALQAMAQRGWRVPTRCLPEVLSIKEAKVRAALRPVLGQRGLWLAGFREDWQWAVVSGEAPPQEVERIWNEGSLPERCLVLRHLRAVHPQQALTWLREAWPREKADARHALLRSLETGLAREDEPFLEQALADRSKDVRSLASQLLAQLPESRHARWLWSMAEPMVRYVPHAQSQQAHQQGGHARPAQPAEAAALLELTLPARFDPTWAEQGLIDAPPAGVSKREYWFWQFVRRIPLARWVEHCGAAPAQLAAAAPSASEGAPVLLAAWSEAAVSQQAAEWYGPLWDAWLACVGVEQASLWGQACNKLILTASGSGKLPQLVERLSGLLGWDPEGTLFCHALEPMAAPWPADVSRAVFAQIVDRLQRVNPKRHWEAYPWLAALKLAARRIAPSCLDEAAVWANAIDASASLTQQPAFLTFCQVIQLRREVARNFAAHSLEKSSHGQEQSDSK